MPDSKNVLFLHVGMHKTGTTFLQLTFESNRSLLLEHDINFPKIQSSYNVPGIHASLVRSIELGDLDSAYEIVSNAFLKAGRVLISAERWTPSLRRYPDQFSRWFTCIQQRGHDIRVIIYLRRQDLYALSNYRASVRNPQNRLSLTYQEYIIRRSQSFNYLDILRQWRQISGRGNVYIRPFERSQWQKGELLSDFLSVLEIDNFAGFSTVPTDTNRSFSAVVTELLRRTNRYRDSGQQQEVIKLLNKTVPETILFDHGRGHPYMTPSEQKKFVEQYADSNREIATEWLGRSDGRLFYDEVELTATNEVADISEPAVKELQALIMERLGNTSSPNRFHQDAAIRLGLFR